MLQYDSKWGNPTDDYDLYVTDIAAQTLYGKSDTTQGTGTGQNPYPKEEVQITNNGTSDTWAFVFVNRYSGVARNMKLLVLNGTLDSRYQTKSGSILGNNKAKDALVVGAIDASEPGNDLIEYFSSQGPSIVTWPTPVTWNKPDITGIDGVFVSGAGGFGQPVSGQTYKVFYGTSAAAPTVAAVAALVLSSKNTLTPAQVKTAVTGTALERGAAGYDTVYGYGLADALAAVNSVKPPSSPGDINKDGTFNIADVSLLLRILSGLNTFPN
jgi:subtilisin family serine protease